MAVSDLTGTTWEFKDSIDVSSNFSYYIDFTSNTRNWSRLLCGNAGAPPDVYRAIKYYTGSTYPIYYKAHWIDDAYKTISITGGTDATNATLIAWLEANGTLTAPQPTPSTTNNIFFGTSSINKVYFGTSEVSKIYYGNTLIYEVEGEPTPTFDPVLANNSWDMIKLASKSNAVPSSWAVGDTKSLTIDGNTYQARLVDTTGKYVRVSDNSTAYLKFELTACLQTKYAFNSNTELGNNRPAQSPLLTDINSGTIYNTIDSSLLSVIEPVKVKVSQGGGSSTQGTLIDYEAKFFFQREHDLLSTKAYSVQAEWDAISAQDEYYISNNTNDARIKQVSGTNSGYLLMSPNYGSSNYVCTIGSYGNGGYYGSKTLCGVALCFAL